MSVFGMWLKWMNEAVSLERQHFKEITYSVVENLQTKPDGIFILLYRPLNYKQSAEW